MNKGSPQLVVLAGGPGVGKSTLLDALSESGFPVIKEAATTIMQQTGLRSPSLLPAAQRNDFRKAVVDFYLAQESLCCPAATVFLDRSLIDTIAYARIEGREIPEDILLSMGNLGGRYHRILELEPLPIYVATEFRSISQAQAHDMHRQIIETYKQYGYAITSIPPLPITMRRDFVIDALGL